MSLKASFIGFDGLGVFRDRSFHGSPKELECNYYIMRIANEYINRAGSLGIPKEPSRRHVSADLHSEIQANV